MGIIQDGIELAKLAGRAANPELVEKATKLNEQLLELSAQNVEFKQRIYELEKELQDAKARLAMTGEIERRKGHVYRKGDSEPYCTRCFDVDRRLVHITVTTLPKQGVTIICPQCKATYRSWPDGLMDG